jgi:hypothetical protein
VIENYGSILRPDIGTLPIQAGWIVIRPKDLEQSVVTDPRRIEFYFDHFRVPGLVSANIFVAWVVFRSTGVADGCCRHALEIPKRFFYSPKTTCAKCRLLRHHSRTISENLRRARTEACIAAASHNMLTRHMHESTTIEQARSPLVVRALNKCGAWLEKVGIRSTCPSAAELIDIAQRRTGLDDFGGGDFFEPLARLLESCHRDARLNVIGKMALRADVVRTLCNRLSIERDRKLQREIAAQEIREPLFIVGLPRSGTTLLHILLAADPANRVPLTWEVMTPSPPSNENEQDRIARAQKNLSMLRWLAPTFENVHATGAELPQECVSMMSPTFMSDQFDTMYNVPSYRGWFLKQNLRPAYEFHHRFLQHLQRRHRAGRWILKAPAHMFAAQTLLSIYPDARFVQTHRDPIEAIASVSSLISILRSVFSDMVDPIQIGRDAHDYWSDAIANFLRERDRLPRERVCDLNYAAIQRDAIGEVRRIYEHFTWRLSSETEERMRHVLANQSQTENGNHRYHPSQFGLGSPERFAAYCERFGLASRDFSGSRVDSSIRNAPDPAASAAR